MRREQLVVDTFVELADTLTSDYDVADFLHLLVDRCVQAMGADTAGVMLETEHGGLRLAAADSEEMIRIERLEWSAGHGPCVEAYRTRKPVIVQDLAAEENRWPNVVPALLDIGMRSGHAFPLKLREDCIGGLNLYRRTTQEFGEGDVRLAQAFADVAAIAILQQRKVSSAQLRADQLEGALNSRIIIEQAKGTLAQRHGMSPQEAFDRIRHHARSHNRNLREVCQEIVEGGDPTEPPDPS